MTAPASVRAVTIRLEPYRRWLPQLVEATCIACDVRPADFVKRQQKHPIIKRARLAFIYAARQQLDRSFPDIAAALGCRCHSSAVEGFKVARTRRGTEPEFCELSDLITAIADQLRRPGPPQIDIQQEMFHDAQAA